MTCHTNEKGANPNITVCEAPIDKVCQHVQIGDGIREVGGIIRKCSNATAPANTCLKGEIYHEARFVSATICICNTDNCNQECTAEDCEVLNQSNELARDVRYGVQRVPELICKAVCKTGEGGEQSTEYPKQTVNSKTPVDPNEPEEPEKDTSTSESKMGSFKMISAALIATFLSLICRN